jgi:TatD DNase family protein
MPWIDSHCHLDAAEFDADRDAVVARARSAGVATMVLPAVWPPNFDAVRSLAHAHGLAYALGIHPLFVDRCQDEALDQLAQALQDHAGDERLVAVGEIGLDYFVPGLDLARQERFYAAQLKLARAHGLPVILHVRRSADGLLKHLRRIDVAGGIAHAFNGSDVQAAQFVARGFKLGFGGAMTFERALQLRRLAATLPDTVPVLETDAPDIPPQWLYVKAQDRAAQAASRNEPAQLPRIAQTLAELRGWTLEETALRTSANVLAALPRLGSLPLDGGGSKTLTGLAPIARPDARLLLLGSFPGVASLQSQQYYAHPRNQFWPILSALWEADLMALPYAQRIEHAQRHGLAIWDVYAACRREGSLDSAIEDAQPNDLAGLVARLPKLAGIAHNGGESARTMRITRALGVPVHRLPSTSPANASWSFERKLAAWREVFIQSGLLTV